MNDFLTVEDINSILLNYGNINEFYVLDSSKFSFNENKQSFTYDFIDIWRENDTFYLYVSNSLWTGGYYITDKDDNYLPEAHIRYIKSRFCYFIDGELPTGFKIHFYMTNYYDNFQLTQLKFYITNLRNFNYRNNHSFSYQFNLSKLYENFDFSEHNISVIIGSETYEGTLIDDNKLRIRTNDPLTESCNCIFRIDDNYYYFFINILKDNLLFYLAGDLLVGAVNKLELRTDGFQDLTGVTGSVNVNGEISDLNFEDKEITVDLSEDNLARDFSINVTVNENEKYYGYTHEFKLKSHYFRPNSFADLKSEMERIGGAPVIELTSQISCTDSINVNHDVLIISNDKENTQINLQNNSIVINDGITIKMENIEFSNGNPAIIQKNNSTVEINNCSILTCTNTNTNDLGSVICCDIDSSSLNYDDDFITTIKNTLFKNNCSAIFHSGQLTVDNCQFLVTNVNRLLDDKPSFLYQVDGDATIINSIFDIDITTDYLCDNQKDIGFSQCLIMCGELGTVNNANHSNLQSDNSLPFFKSPYNNKSHLFVKYFYPSINSCVFSSPVVNYEDKSCCHAVSGVNWVYKDNIQITRANWQSENKKRIIGW